MTWNILKTEHCPGLLMIRNEMQMDDSEQEITIESLPTEANRTSSSLQTKSSQCCGSTFSLA